MAVLLDPLRDPGVPGFTELEGFARLARLQDEVPVLHPLGTSLNATAPRMALSIPKPQMHRSPEKDRTADHFLGISLRSCRFLGGPMRGDG